MVLPTTCFILLLVACGCLLTTAQAQMMTDGSDTEPGWFLRQLDRILSNAKLEGKHGLYTVYWKNGNHNTAIADYESLRPVDAENRPASTKGPSRVGYSEDRLIFVSRKNTVITYMAITKANSENIEILIKYVPVRI